jgi:energy-coupling factor transporter ATP-binding protein EcfA2
MSATAIVSLIAVLLFIGLLVFHVLKSSPPKPKPLTILVCGATGVGKSTLINRLVGFPASQTGIGAPVTQNTVRVENPSGEMAFYDSKGLEVLDASQTYLLLMSDVLRLRFGPILRDHIDVVLMCIQEPQGRVDDAHREIAGLCEDFRVPYGIAITKTEGNPALEKAIRREFVGAAFVRRVRSLESRYQEIVIPAEGLDQLLGDMYTAASKSPAADGWRARKGREALYLADLARHLAYTGSTDDALWIRFGHDAFQHLGMTGVKWKNLTMMARKQVQRSLVPNFFARNLNSSFDNQKIDGAVARRIVPVVMRRFADNSLSLNPVDINTALAEAISILQKERPYRSRF